MFSVLQDLLSKEIYHSRNTATQPSSKHLSVSMKQKSTSILEILLTLPTDKMGREKGQLQMFSPSFSSKKYRDLAMRAPIVNDESLPLPWLICVSYS